MRLRTRLGKFLALALLGVCTSGQGVLAEEATFSAQLDRASISQDESVSVKFILRSDNAGTITEMPRPEFVATDFDVVNEFSGSFVESSYINGQFLTQANRQLTLVMRPKRSGRLRILAISIKVGGRVLKAPDLVLDVVASGAATAPPQTYGGGGVGLRGAGKRPNSAGYFIRAELDKSRVFQGEQVIISYYLYARVRVSQVVATKYPTMNGFVKSDLEIPVGGVGQLRNEQVILDSVPYTRTLMARYAATPMRAGRLNIDTMGVNLTYLGDALFDRNDIMNLFQRMLPGTRTGSALSDVLTLEVEALPTAGKPSQFSGGIGDFEVTSVVDRTEVKAGEPVTLTVKLEGRGNTASIELPKLELPPGVDVFESKGRALPQKTAISSKVFDVVLIPRRAGTYEVPSPQFSFFDPNQKTYVTKGAPGFSIRVAENPNAPAGPAPGVNVGQRTGGGLSPGATSSSRQQAVAEMPNPEPIWAEDATSSILYRPSYAGRLLLWASRLAWVLWLLASVLVGILTWAGYQAWRVSRKRGQPLISEREKAAAQAKSWKSLESACDRAEAGAPWSEVARAYEALSGVVFDLLDRMGAGGARALARSEMAERLTSAGKIPSDEWVRYERLLEYAETVRFAIQAGMVTEADARKALRKWVAEAKTLEKAFALRPNSL